MEWLKSAQNYDDLQDLGYCIFWSVPVVLRVHSELHCVLVYYFNTFTRKVQKPLAQPTVFWMAISHFLQKTASLNAIRDEAFEHWDWRSFFDNKMINDNEDNGKLILCCESMWFQFFVSILLNYIDVGVEQIQLCGQWLYWSHSFRDCN